MREYIREKWVPVLGDPVGPQEDIPHLLAEFTAFCNRNDWYPAFYQVLPDFLALYQAHGYKTLKIGEEAVVDLPTFTLAGKSHKSLRQTVSRIERKSYTTELYFPPLNNEILKSLKEVSDEWLRSQKGGEKRFSLGWFDAEYIRSCPVIVVKDRREKFRPLPTSFPNTSAGKGPLILCAGGEWKGGWST